MTRALVIGGAGFLGSCIVRELLHRSVETVIFSRSLPVDGLADAFGGCEIVCGSCSDSDALRKAVKNCDVVFHVGAYYPLYSVDRISQERRALAELRTVLDAVLRGGVERFLFTSSPMVLADDPTAFARSAYNSIKRQLHDEVVQWVDRGLPGIIVIPGACFGPGDRKPTTGRLILEIARGRLPFVVDGRMNAVDCRDVAHAQVNIAERCSAGSCYELGGWNCTITEFARVVAQLAGAPPPFVSLPYVPLRLIAGMIERVQYRLGSRLPLLPQSGLDQAHYGTFLDSAAAVHDCGFSARPIERTILDTIAYFVREGMLTIRNSRAQTPRYSMPGGIIYEER